MIIDRKTLYRKPDGTTMTSQEQLALLLSLGNFTSAVAADITGVQYYTIKTYRKASSKRAVPASIIRPLERAVFKKLAGIADAAGYAMVPKQGAAACSGLGQGLLSRLPLPPLHHDASQS